MMRPLKVLIVEDNANDAELLVRELDRVGFEPEYERTDTADGLYRLLGAAGWDLVLSDYSLPGFSALEALAIVQASGLSIPFIIVSGTIGEDTAVEAMRKGAADYLLKDRLGRLGPAVEHALEQGRLRRETRRAQDALAESEERFRQLAENIQEVFWISDAHTGRMLYVSPAFERVWGVAARELYSQPSRWVDAVHPDDRVAVDQAASRKAEGGYELEFRIVRPDESVRWIRDRAFPVRNRDGVVYRIVGVAEDITERRRLEERFLRTQRMEVIGSLTSGITHDLNNILSSMLMAAGLVKSRTKEARDREMLVTIEKGAQRGARMIAQLLTFSRGSEGTRTSLRPGVIVDEVAGLLRATFPRIIDVQVKVPPYLHNVLADATQLHQVLMNLCVNARDAMTGGGRIMMAAENRELDDHEAKAHANAKPGPYVMLKVADNGAGMPAPILERIFDPFFTTKDPGKGTGLGLSSVLGIVKSHGGFVTVTSEVGKGSEFRVFLPASAESASPFVTGSAGPFPMAAGELVLVVDDEADVLKVSASLLDTQGYRVLAAANGEEALTLFLQHAEAVRAVVTNLHMPGMGGLALLQALRVLDYLNVGFVVASGEETPDLREEFDRLGVVEFLPKPIARSKLLHAVARAVDAARTSRLAMVGRPGP